MKLFIHIGYPKTATTFLQNVVFNNLDHSIVNYIGKTDTKYEQWLIEWQYLDDIAFEAEKERIKEDLWSRIDPNRINIISSEAFTRFGGVIPNMINRIKSIAPSAKIILVLRDPIQIIYSAFKYNIEHEGFFKPLEELIDYKRTPMVFYKRKPIYLPDLFFNETIQYIENKIGRDHLSVLKFEDLADNPTGFMKKLFDFLNYSGEIGSHLTTTKSNVSMPANKIKMKAEENINSLLEKYCLDHDPVKVKASAEYLLNEDQVNEIANILKGKTFGYY